MSVDYWIVQGQQCLWIALLFYTLSIGGRLSERWKERHPEWRRRLPGDHRAGSPAVARLRTEAVTPWGAVKVKPGVVEHLGDDTP